MRKEICVYHCDICGFEIGDKPIQLKIDVNKRITGFTIHNENNEPHHIEHLCKNCNNMILETINELKEA